MTLYTPIELEKLCYNKIIECFYDESEYKFSCAIQDMNLPDNIQLNLLERYRTIKHIMKVERLQMQKIYK